MSPRRLKRTVREDNSSDDEVALELDAPLRAVAKSPSKMKRIMIEESDEEKTSEGHNEDKFKASPTRDGNISTLPDEPGESKRSTTSSSIFDTSGATDEVSAWSDAMARVIAKSSRGSSSARAVGSTEKPWGAGGEVGRTEDSDAAGDASHATAVDLSLDIEEDTARHGNERRRRDTEQERRHRSCKKSDIKNEEDSIPSHTKSRPTGEPTGKGKGRVRHTATTQKASPTENRRLSRRNSSDDEFSLNFSDHSEEPQPSILTRSGRSSTRKVREVYDTGRRSSRPRRAEASSVADYSCLNEGEPSESEVDDDGHDVMQTPRKSPRLSRALSITNRGAKSSDRVLSPPRTKRKSVGRSVKSRGTVNAEMRNFIVDGSDDDEDADDDEEEEFMLTENSGSGSGSGGRRAKKKRAKRVHSEAEDEGEEEEEEEEEEGEEQQGIGSHAMLFHQQMLEEDDSDLDDSLSKALMSPGKIEDEEELFTYYIEFLAKAVQGGGEGGTFMEKFASNRRKYGLYRRAVKKFEDRICTVRESIAGGGSWNQDFKTAVMKHAFVGFGHTYSDLDSGGDSREDLYEMDPSPPEPCAACHRAEFANVSRMYLAGCAYDPSGLWTRARWDKLLPKGWDNAAATDTSKRKLREILKLGGTCRYKSHLYHTLLHYKLYLVCKVRRKMDMEHITPEMLRDEQFKDFAATEKDSVDRLMERAEVMAAMRPQLADWQRERWDGVKAIRKWLSVPEEVVEREEVTWGHQTKLGHPSDSQDSEGLSSAHDEPSSFPSRRGGANIEESIHGTPQRGSGQSNGRARSDRKRSGRYKTIVSSSDSEDFEDDLSNFIVYDM